MKKILCMALIAAALSGCIEKGTGEKMGVLTKLAHEGAVCATWEAEIVRGGMVGGTGVNGQAFHFTIEDEVLVKKLKDAMENQKEVKITYRTEKFTFCRSETANNFLVDVTIIEPNKSDAVVVGKQVTGNREETIVELLKVQAKLITELAK